jgi:hypothetical protein
LIVVNNFYPYSIHNYTYFDIFLCLKKIYYSKGTRPVHSLTAMEIIGDSTYKFERIVKKTEDLNRRILKSLETQYAKGGGYVLQSLLIQKK